MSGYNPATLNIARVGTGLSGAALGGLIGAGLGTKLAGPAGTAIGAGFGVLIGGVSSVCGFNGGIAKDFTSAVGWDLLSVTFGASIGGSFGTGLITGMSTVPNITIGSPALPYLAIPVAAGNIIAAPTTLFGDLMGKAFLFFNKEKQTVPVVAIDRYRPRW